jgi:hypothetical protein
MGKAYKGMLTPYLDEIKKMSVDGLTIPEIAKSINEKYHARIDYQHVRYALYRVGGPIHFVHRIEHTRQSRLISEKIFNYLALLNKNERRAVLSDLFKGEFP